MGLVAIIIGLIVVLTVLELFKHHFTKSLFKYMIMAIVLIFVLLIASAYVDLGSFFSQDNTFAKTGAVIADDVTEDLEDLDLSESKTLETIEEKTKDFFHKLIDG